MQTAAVAISPESVLHAPMAHVVEHGARAFEAVAEKSPAGFPEELHAGVRAAANPRLRALDTFTDAL